jgi:hypothetical protein
MEFDHQGRCAHETTAANAADAHEMCNQGDPGGTT